MKKSGTKVADFCRCRSRRSPFVDHVSDVGACQFCGLFSTELFDLTEMTVGLFHGQTMIGWPEHHIEGLKVHDFFDPFSSKTKFSSCTRETNH
jgi:hypothetical protein